MALLATVVLLFQRISPFISSNRKASSAASSFPTLYATPSPPHCHHFKLSNRFWGIMSRKGNIFCILQYLLNER
ncbi:hypothetical protein QVD17_19626 [Tagetes erecta]|uniref:Secreted protein n=1 Tax=Tagetes erecta TaxID=13708 RepID=A0AAD8KK94_TARER|nr:hypothetical protein QVD17_19626 [Tagetes erecta]